MDFRFVGPLLLYLLLASVMLLADAYSLLVLADRYGLYLVLGSAGSVSLLGVVAAVLLLARRLRLLRQAVYLSESPWRHYRNALALFVGGLLFLPPGAVTTALGIMCLLPVIRHIPGWVLTALTRAELNPVYDFLKMEDAHADGMALSDISNGDASAYESVPTNAGQ